MLIIENWIWL